MAKFVVFSFDDGREDTFTRAYPILRKYNMPFTLNVCTDFVVHPERYSCFQSADNKSVEPEHLVELQQNGIEIACHGHLHQNTPGDILDNIAALEKMGIEVHNIGFASPNSVITEENSNGVLDLVEKGVLSYVRSGTQVRREGLLYSVLTYLERKTHSLWLFRWLNRKNTVNASRTQILMSVAITRHTTVKQILNFVEYLKDDEGVILMFHSVIEKDDRGYGKDNWYFDAKKLEDLCEKLNHMDILVCTTQQLIQRRGV